ncbi:MAG: phenylalanine--tRNA ligase subunit alpha [Candidatus Heimdallarchaeota archaeon]|nr:phenylalanine--tRNA ligase subunit alpha [Candidatus Heimdallarchaeota archaeon]MCK5047920.1 phenylalanine--tRNA ligase subunit alpha [Candidatus Heimdallarchaeota archaeon]
MNSSVTLTPEMEKVLRFLSTSKKITIDKLAERLSFPRAKVDLLTSELEKLKLVNRGMKTISRADLTADGSEVVEKGLPENRLLNTLKAEKEGIPMAKIGSFIDLPKNAINAGIGKLRKEQLITITKGIVTCAPAAEPLNAELEEALSKIADNPFVKIDAKILSELSQRGSILIKERQETTAQITDFGVKELPNIKVTEEVSRLTPDQIKTGDWRSLNLKKFNLASKPKTIPSGRKHPYLSFLDEVKTKLIGLGFSEMRGPLVETEFWNFDALYQAQDHPAREWTDVYVLKNPTHGNLPLDKELVKNVQIAHETGDPVGSRGWRYKWDPKKAARLMLRPQGTAVSARTLYNLKIPSKYFSIARCFRPDSVDASHLSEFNQMEGIVCDPTLTFRDLLGILKTFAEEVAGVTNIRFKPDYYPFTSPSVEMSALHPTLGYIEFGGAGIFRPEVTAPFGITEPVIAWGLGVDRLFMVKQEINDIRELYTHNLDWLRKVPLT